MDFKVVKLYRAAAVLLGGAVPRWTVFVFPPTTLSSASAASFVDILFQPVQEARSFQAGAARHPKNARRNFSEPVWEKLWNFKKVTFRVKVSSSTCAVTDRTGKAELRCRWQQPTPSPFLTFRTTFPAAFTGHEARIVSIVSIMSTRSRIRRVQINKRGSYVGDSLRLFFG